jgi:hypothetical protein
MNRFWAHHRTTGTAVPGVTIDRGRVTDAATRAASSDHRVAGGYPRVI